MYSEFLSQCRYFGWMVKTPSPYSAKRCSEESLRLYDGVACSVSFAFHYRTGLSVLLQTSAEVDTITGLRLADSLPSPNPKYCNAALTNTRSTDEAASPTGRFVISLDTL